MRFQKTSQVEARKNNNRNIKRSQFTFEHDKSQQTAQREVKIVSKTRQDTAFTFGLNLMR